MSSQTTIHCVDDDESTRALLLEALKEYHCLALDSGAASLAAAAENPPDLVLLDVQMSGMDGLQTCRKLRESPELHDIPVMFLSGNDTLEERLDGYAAGGDDYLAKPLEPEELRAKVRAALKRKERLDRARQDAHAATLSVSEIMATMGEMSTVVSFFQNTFTVRSYEVLARRIIQAHETLGLDVLMEFLVDDERLHFSTTGEESPLEASVFEYVRSKGRLVDCGQRAAVNFPQITIIVRNMPQDNLEFRGRIRDHIALIAEGADAKIRALQSDLLIKQQRGELFKIISELESTVAEVQSDYNDQQQLSEIIFAAAVSQLEDSFLALGLTEQQEDYQRAIIDMAEEKNRNLYAAGLSLEGRFSAILDTIHNTQQQCCGVDEAEDSEDENDLAGEAVVLF